MLVVGAWFASACSTEGEGTEPLDAGADVVDESTQVGACTLSGTACTGQTVCCGPFSGHVVDIDAGCKARAETPIGCHTPGSCRLTLAGMIACYRRTNDDGTTTTFYTRSLYPRPPSNVARCDQDEATHVTSYPDCP